MLTDATGRFHNVSFVEGEGRVLGGRFVPQTAPNPDVTAKRWDINKLQIMPRLGIAYRFSDTWVLRMGAGQFYNAQQINSFSILNLHPSYSGSKNLENDRTNPVAAGPLSSNPNPGYSADDTPTMAARATTPWKDPGRKTWTFRSSRTSRSPSGSNSSSGPRPSTPSIPPTSGTPAASALPR